ncbi:MAG: polysaccharide biosynthesis tyrosine autokinase [Sphingobium sp.]|nr:polysaccharide biosynthesis tyrosine autokinase [Sphingobium sp.]
MYPHKAVKIQEQRVNAEPKPSSPQAPGNAYTDYGQAYTERDSLVDLGSVIETVRRRKLPMAIACAIILVLTAVTYLMSDRVYMASGRVAVDRQDNDIVNVEGSQRPLTTDSPSVDTEVQVILSPNTAMAVVENLKLQDRPGFGFPEGTTPAKSLEDRKQRAMRTVMNSLKVQREGTSYAIVIGARNPDAAIAAEIANGVMDAYVGQQRSGKAQARSQEIEMLRSRLDELRDDVIAANRDVAQYRSSANLVSSGDDVAGQQALAGLNSQYATARAESAAANARASASRRGSVTDITNNAVINNLKGTRANLLAKKSDLEGRYGAMHPALVSVNSQIAEIDRNIQAETERVRMGVAAEANAASQRAGALASSAAQQRASILAASSASVKLKELEQKADGARQVYQTHLDRYLQAVAVQGAESSKSYIVARALKPSFPETPKLAAFAMGGIAAGLIAAIALAVVLEVMEKGFRSRREVEKTLGLPVIASVPDLMTMKERPVRGSGPISVADYMLHEDGSVFTEAIRSIRTRLRIGQNGQVAKTVAIVSSLPGEGKTTTSICLARSAALSGRKVVLVDCDMRRRATTRSLKNELSVGLADVLRGTATVDQVLVKDEQSGAYLLPQRHYEPGDFDLIPSKAMESLVDTLSRQFDLVILDTAPILPIAEARAVAAMADAVLVVVRWRVTPVTAVQIALSELGRAGANVVGTVLSQVDVRSASTGNEVYYYQHYEPIKD